ncbi:MAG: PQQ-binding-like beta-propeller repeat protein [Anaerolineales bacterium]
MIVKRRAVALVLVAALVALTGCVQQGALTNPGWTVVAERDGIVYAALATGSVVALDAAQGGEVVWKYPEKVAAVGCGVARTTDESGESLLNAVYGEPLVLDDVVLVGSFSGDLYAFGRESGKPEWTYQVDGAIVGGVTEADGVLYFGSSDGKVYALDAATREPVWAEPFATGNRVWGTPRVDETRVYVASMDHSVYAIERSTGKMVWSYDLGASAPGTLTLADGRLYVGSVSRYLTCLSAADGSELWRSPQYEAWVWGEALVVGDGVYFGSLDGKMHALHAVDGSKLWNDVQLNGAVRAGPALDGESLIVGTESGYVYTIDMSTGKESLLFGDREGEKLGAVLSTPVVSGNMVYVGTSIGNVVALDLTLRDPVVWVYPPTEAK